MRDDFNVETGLKQSRRIEMHVLMPQGSGGAAALGRKRTSLQACSNSDMELATQYGRQYGWRSWPYAYEALPSLNGARVLDLGCAIGDQSRDLTSRGAQVVGVDADEYLIAHARSRQIPGAVFKLGDVRDPGLDGKFDGIWPASFPPTFLTLPLCWPVGATCCTLVAGSR